MSDVAPQIAPGASIEREIESSSPLILTAYFGAEQRPVDCIHAEDFTGFTIVNDELDLIGLALAVGAAAIYMPLTPRRAREIAAQLLRMADYVDGGKGKQ